MFKVGFFVEIMIWVLFFLIQYGNLYLLIAVFRLWTFNVIIYMTGLKSIITSCFLFFPSVLFSPLPFNAFSAVNLASFNDFILPPMLIDLLYYLLKIILVAT